MSTQNLERVHELLVRRGDAAAGAVAGGAERGAGGAGVGVMHDVARRDAAVSADVDAAAGEVGTGGEPDRAAVGQGDGLLGSGLAGGRLADQGGPLKLLQSRRTDLGLAEGVGVDEHAHRKLDAHAVGLGDLLPAVFVLHDKEPSARQQVIEKFRDLGIQAAGVAAQVDTQGVGPLVEQTFDGGLAVLRRTGLEVLDLEIARLGLLQTGEDGADIHAGAVDLDLLFALVDAEGELGVEAGADQLSRLVEGLVGQVDVVDAGDDVPGGESRPGRGRVHIDGHDLKAAALLFQKGHADPGVFAGGAELIGLVFVGRHVVAPLVAEARDDGGRRVVPEGVAVDRVYEAFVDHVLDLDVAHGLIVFASAADRVEHVPAGLPVRPADKQKDREDHIFEPYGQIEYRREKVQDTLKDSLSESHEIPP